MKVHDLLFRLFLEKHELDAVVAFYEDLLAQPCTLRFSYDEMQLELAQVGKLLFIAGTPKARQPFERTKLTAIVDSIHEAVTFLTAQPGAAVLETPKRVPTGWNLLARHPDGTVVEYVQHVVESVASVNQAQ